MSFPSGLYLLISLRPFSPPRPPLPAHVLSCSRLRTQGAGARCAVQVGPHGCARDLCPQGSHLHPGSWAPRWGWGGEFLSEPAGVPAFRPDPCVCGRGMGKMAGCPLS